MDIDETSDDERTYTFGDGSGYTEEHTARPSTVRADLRAWIKGGDWSDNAGGDVASTMWIHATYRCEDTDERGDVTVEIEPDEPTCAEDEHDWQSPHEIVGGIKENPGVRGNGGGVIVQEVCQRCGCGRTTNTWAQDPSTGRQGLTSVTYDRDYLADVHDLERPLP